ncbi:hypothetical protein F0M18_01195 [Pseudohalioglobus sediminis]|uniref:Uncharacterized protein n=1 Tax=Pseudohalioglobus sediminis TaxID=2606449 RepID=A0A5B0X695_9GAMM|nr:hypothetical protein [Pseudohalioglobus sediminis]KAA1194088.1 hypothetical protein F0M18_01195 [Pseudohalioglobus sediminis]
MGQYEKAFENHEVHAVTQQLLSTLNEKLESDLEDTGDDQRNHLHQAAKYVQARLKVASPVLTTSAQLDPLRDHIKNSLHQYNQYVSRKNEAHLTNAANEINSALTRAVTLPSLETSIPGFTSEDALQFGKIVEEHLNRIRASSSDVDEKLEDLKSLTDSMTAEAESLRQQLISVKGKQEQFEETFDQKAEAALAQSEAAANEQREAFKVLFENESGTRANHFQSEIDRITQAHEDELEKLSEKNKQHFQFLAEQKKRVENVVGLIENDGLTGNFQRTAKEERTAANRLRWGAILSYVVMVGIILWTAFDVTSLLSPAVGEEMDKAASVSKVDYFLLFARLFTAFILLIPARYLASEASKHMAVSERNRRFELELATIDAYFMYLPEEERAKEKAKFGEKYFGQIDNEQVVVDGSINAPELLKSLQAIVMEALKRN